MVAGIYIAAVVLALALWVYRSGKQPLLLNRGREDFERQVRSLLMFSENGGALKVQGRSTGVEFECLRVSGSEKGVGIKLSIPRSGWSESHRDAIREALNDEGYEVENGSIQSGDKLIEVWIEVADIWEEAAGARAARAAHLILDAMSISRDEKFNSRLGGPRSLRALRHRQ